MAIRPALFVCLMLAAGAPLQAAETIRLSAAQQKTLQVVAQTAGEGGAAAVSALPALVVVPNAQMRVVAAPVGGLIDMLAVAPGSRVKKGQVVIRLDNRDLAALLDSAKAQLKGEEARLDGARAAMTSAEVELTRRQKLASNGDIPKTQLEAAQKTFAQVSRLSLFDIL